MTPHTPENALRNFRRNLFSSFFPWWRSLLSDSRKTKRAISRGEKCMFWAHGVDIKLMWSKYWTARFFVRIQRAIGPSKKFKISWFACPYVEKTPKHVQVEFLPREFEISLVVPKSVAHASWEPPKCSECRTNFSQCTRDHLECTGGRTCGCSMPSASACTPLLESLWNPTP